ncbi:glycoside hydrolase family 92 protein [Lasiosphaeria miniovina]|uniref:Glycoside hydrolase family 92 protein n=1 Tax=Lasiosphaeria miniovina TaxID=1954250 RepID=A0AA40AU24_9PEZI|nr:glycoside hydrolase family 92 protein [Lasiosphaeria miniovina]KAK0721988.1 glycoside hydrolase family 92 protein [Lasiosphaeria miniovina]
MMAPFLALCCFLGLAHRLLAQSTFDPLAYVDPLIGASDGGNVFPGASLPYGMAKAVADTNSSSNQGGFTLDGSVVTGFSTMHDSGTGGSPSLGNFALFPYTNCPGGDIDQCAFPKKARARFGAFANSSVSAKPGTFGITLAGGIRAEMTTTQHASLFSFSFPSTGLDGQPAQPLILQDLTDLADSRQDNGSVSVDSETGRITGSARFLPSFGGGNFVLYFCTDFKGAEILDSGIFVNSRASAAVKNLTISRSINGYPLPGGAFVRFKSGAKPILVRTATSFISAAQACSHVETEIPGFDFAGISNAATEAWRAKMSPIKVSTKGVNESTVTNFYSGIYRTMINPQNYTGENPLWSSSEPYFDSFYCIWDLFRSQLPFLTITDPVAVAQMIRSLIDTYRHVGWLPDCRMSLNKGYTQGGSNADNVLADAFIKGIKDGINWNDGYTAVVKDAEVEPYDWCCEGRGGLDSWKSLGYIPVQDFDYKGFGTMTRSISRTLEYSYNDFCISQIAKGLGKTGDEEKYLGTSEHWKNLYKADQTSAWWNGTDTGFVGFFEPRFLNKTWGFQNPLNCSNLDQFSVCSLQNTGRETFESSIWEYGFFVPHDQATLMTLLGGPEAFVRRLDYLHDQNITYIGNEPAFLTVFQYHYAGRPALSAKRSHFYIPSFFAPTPDGLPGNDDSGAMGSFVAFAMMGLFPNPGQDVYLITPPYFERVAVTNPTTGATAVVRNVGFDASYRDIYIQSATLDGEPYTRNWIDHSFFTDGKELVLTLGRNESTWGTHVDDLPPSLGHYAGFNGTYSAKRMTGATGVRSYRGEFGISGNKWGS